MFYLDIETLKRSHITLGLTVINISFYLIFNILLPIDYLLLLAQQNSKVIENLEIWRLLTSIFLHADVLHLFSNSVALIIFGAAVEDTYKKIEFLIIYFVSGVIGNIFSLFLLSYNSISLGASGAIFGLIGAAFILFIKEDKTLLLIGGLYLAYFLISSLGPGINLWAHLFGLLGGLLFGYLFKKNSDRFYLDH